MISRLEGLLLAKQNTELLMDVQGVGYEVHCPLSTLFALPNLGECCVLHTHLSIREDAHVLYGFATAQERLIFRTLIRINGVGPKLALAILGSMETERFIRSIQEQDPQALVKIPGVGKKTAERLIVEMKDKLGSLGDIQQSLLTPIELQVEQQVRSSTTADAEQALIALGYKANQAEKVVAKVRVDGMSSQELIRAALKAL